MTLIDDIRADRGAGTPGPWRIGNHDPMRGIWIGGSNENGGAVLPYLWFGHTINFPNEYEANARRIARVPELEDAYESVLEENARLRDALSSIHQENKHCAGDSESMAMCIVSTESYARAALAETGGPDR